MKFQQLVYVREVARSNLNVSKASKTLFTSQPGISKQIKLLEEELDVELFERSGKHLVAITPVGERILEQIEEILALVDGIKHAATEFSDEEYGTLSIATTHTQAKFTLPKVVDKFVKRYPNVKLWINLLKDIRMFIFKCINVLQMNLLRWQRKEKLI